MRGITIFLIVLMAAAPAAAQSGQVGAPSPELGGEGAVQVGAGTTSEVTTGDSGPSGDDGEDEKPEPIAVDMPYPPQGEGLLSYPGRLEIVPPRSMHCDIISDENARLRCEEGGIPGPEAAAVDNLNTQGGAISLNGQGDGDESGGGAGDGPQAPGPLGVETQDREEP